MAGPGFLNLFMSDGWYLDALAGVLGAGRRFGAGTAETPEHVNVEFVSANPTGPITVASARHGVYGDSLCRILEYAGHRVEREYYVNDAGGADAPLRRVDPRAGPWGGAARGRLSRRLRGRPGGRRSRAPPRWTWTSWPQRGIDLILEGVRASLARLRVQMDRYSLEHELHDQRRRA